MMLASTLRRPLRLAGLAALAAGAALAGTPASAKDDGGQPALELAVLDRVQVCGDRVDLRDLVAVRRDDAGIAGPLLSLDMGPAPRVGQPAHVDRAQLQDWLRVHKPALAPFVRWSGAGAVEIERASQALPAQELDELARQALGEWLAQRCDRYEIEALHPFEAVAVPAGSVSMAVRPLSAIGLPSSRMSVWIDVSLGGRFLRSVVMDYRVKAFRTAWVAADELARGEDLDETRATSSEVDVATTSQALWTQPVSHARLRRPVHRGQVLTLLDVEDRPPIVRGERVAVFSHVGELSIETSAEALQDGRSGQDVLVRIPSSSAPVMARVLKPGLVEIRQ